MSSRSRPSNSFSSRTSGRTLAAGSASNRRMVNTSVAAPQLSVAQRATQKRASTWIRKLPRPAGIFPPRFCIPELG